MPRVLVLGDDRYRGAVADAISTIPAVDAVDCDPALGDCVMYVRLEGARYDAFVFLGWNHPVTRGGLAIVAERSVLLPVLEPGEEPHLDHDAYLFRLPRALGFRDAGERVAAVEAVPKAAAVPGEIVGSDALDAAALGRLLAHATSGSWQWAELVERVAAEERDRRPRAR